MNRTHLAKALADAEALRDLVNEMEACPEFYKLANYADGLVEILTYLLKREEHRAWREFTHPATTAPSAVPAKRTAQRSAYAGA